MSTQTKGVTCPPGLYTLLADGKASVAIGFRIKGSGRMAIAASQPSPTTSDYWSLRAGDEPDLSAMTTGDKVYFMATDNPVVIEVKAGG